MNFITLDQDLLHIAIDYNLPIFLRTDKKPNYKLDEELYVKETWRKTPFGYEFMLDSNRSGLWNYANQMPIEIAKRKAKVVIMQEIEESEYNKFDIHEIVYNKRIYGIKDCPDDRWFRKKSFLNLLKKKLILQHFI